MFEKDEITSISISTGTLIRVALVALGVFLLWYLHGLILIILSAIVLASFVESTLPYFAKIKISRIWGVVIFYFLSILIFAGVFYLFAPLLITEVYNFSTFISHYVQGVDFLEYFKSNSFSGAKDLVANLSNNFSLPELLSVSKAFITNLSGGFFQTLSITFGSIFNFILIIIISFYLSIQERGIEDFLGIIVPAKYEDYVIDLWQRSNRKIALWIRGQMKSPLKHKRKKQPE